VLSAANEIAVEAFLDRRIPWLAISEVNGRVLEEAASAGETGNVRDVPDVLEADRAARARARAIVEAMERTS
jgi:1-deoxy-D-xylulose-5-phosphate reductoisomerase